MKNIALRIVRLLLAAFFLAAFGTAQAQLVSNLGSPTDGAYGGGPDSADDVLTGTAGLTVTRIDIEWEIGNGGVNQVGIYTDNAGLPSTTQVGTFFVNPNPTVAGVMSYTGTANLAPNTTYWIVADITDGSSVAYTFTNTVTSSPATGGATIPDGNSAFGDNLTGAWTSDPANLKFALFGPVPAPGVAVTVPTLSEWSLVLLALLMAGAAIGFRRRS